MSTSTSSDSALAPPACVHCRKSKVKCEGGIPCKRCIRMNNEATCTRCIPRKRGRKPRSEKPSKEKKLKLEHIPVDEPIRPKQTLGFLADEFQSWRETTLKGQTAENSSRLAWICQRISTILGGLEDPLPPHLKRLASDVQSCYSLIPSDIIASVPIELPKELTSKTSLDVFRALPIGTALIPTINVPNIDDYVWVNDRLCQQLGYPKDELLRILRKPGSWSRVMDFDSIYSRFLKTVAAGTDHFRSATMWKKKNKEEIQLLGSHQIVFEKGVPVFHRIFIQTASTAPTPVSTGPSPTRVGKLQPLQVAPEEKVLPDSYRITPTSYSQFLPSPMGRLGGLAVPSPTARLNGLAVPSPTGRLSGLAVPSPTGLGFLHSLFQPPSPASQLFQSSPASRLYPFSPANVSSPLANLGFSAPSPASKIFEDMSSNASNSLLQLNNFARNMQAESAAQHTNNQAQGQMRQSSVRSQMPSLAELTSQSRPNHQSNSNAELTNWLVNPNQRQ